MPEEQYHWFCTSCASFEFGYNLSEVLDGLRQRDGKLNINDTQREIWKVPGPQDREYKIANYAPQVEGAIYIGRVDLEPED